MFDYEKDTWDLIGTSDTHCIALAERQSLEKLGHNISNEQRWLPYNFTTRSLTKWQLNDSFPTR